MSRLRFWASVLPLISNSLVVPVGSIIEGFVLSKFFAFIQFLANIAISIMAAHLDHSSGGSTDAFCQNGGILSGFLYVSC